MLSLFISETAYTNGWTIISTVATATAVQLHAYAIPHLTCHLKH